MAPLWFLTRDGDPAAFQIARRHYSAWKNPHPTTTRFVGPGERIVLRTGDADALFVWRHFIDDSGQTGVCCSLFRNESKHQSSELIRQACRIADAVWPHRRRYTFIDPQKITSTNPGCCFKKAGWKLVRSSDGSPLLTPTRLLIMELQDAEPQPAPPAH